MLSEVYTKLFVDEHLYRLFECSLFSYYEFVQIGGDVDKHPQSYVQKLTFIAVLSNQRLNKRNNVSLRLSYNEDAMVVDL